ncbi:hypothetical protein Mtc_2170 [Methanocella conradii HZ254]|uniref:Uncharacterized protein n=1 Tax=Methanocella conradii (strain DSM 24694 / JCM 17849 / CGMCC 1.5162 / HZ254) TaxID=1041930 RepID=H8I889_METCZ|nr:hypothetical protein [Methanocella conradii]AFD00907.1 hypothetical protein Mtc_2170 [Methanocella conradii HZ254]
MSFNKLMVLVLLGLLLGFGVTAHAQCVPLLAQPPLGGVGLPVPYGNFGNGITDTWYTTTGVGGAASTDSFLNGFVGPSSVQGFGGFAFPAFDGFGCGPLPSAFAGWGPFQAGVGGNWGAQNSAAMGVARSMTFGLQPTGLVFGVPVAGPGGFVFT